MSQVEISPRLALPARPIPTVDELRAAPPSRFEQCPRSTGPGTYVTLHKVDYATVGERWRDLGSERSMRVYCQLAEEFGCTEGTIRRALRRSGAQ